MDLGWRHIGTSNMTIPKLQLLLRDARIRPAMNEMELHPHFQQPELFDFVRANGIQPIGYSPIGSPSRPNATARRKNGGYRGPRDPRNRRRIGVHPAVVCVKWAVSAGRRRFRFPSIAGITWPICEAR